MPRWELGNLLTNVLKATSSANPLRTHLHHRRT